MGYLFFLLMVSIALAGCGTRKPSSLDMTKFKFASPSPNIVALPGVPITDESLIKEVLAISLNKNPSDLIIIMSANDETYAAGTVMIKNDSVGRTWYAIKEKGGWQVVWQGSDNIKCSDLKGYEDYPTKLIPECINDSGTIEAR